MTDPNSGTPARTRPDRSRELPDEPEPTPVVPDRLTQIHEFLLFCDRYKRIERRNPLTDGSRPENDAEHTWHMALYALMLKDEIGADVDITRVLAMILVHDLVEIHAGDTFAYDAVGREGQAEREEAAATELFAMLPDDLRDRVWSWWREFETGDTAEAEFARALDRLQAFGQNVRSGGLAHREHGVSRTMTFDRMRPARRADDAIRLLVDRLYAEADGRPGYWLPERGAGK
ncbi:HD domain-containing protein [Fodinicurvata sp. EGI_FJ10296]|uniref:HD domain-containing protein n=1 Tax=Fodinicurvata sp. EGI_FJ10296 TaxID=3231908 RepID=UPI0034520DF6